MVAPEPRSLSPSPEPAALLPGDTALLRRRILRPVGGIPVTIALLLLAGVVVALFITRWDVWVGASVCQSTDDAYLRSDITPLSAKIEGYVRRVPVNAAVGERDLRVDVADDPVHARLRHDHRTQSLRGLAVGAFIPVSLGFILRSLTPQWWIWGLAAYAFRFVFSQNIAGSLVLVPVMTALVCYAMPRVPIDLTLLRQTDWRGLALVGVGLGLIYAGIDQGNRLNWPIGMSGFRLC
jgi:hypothetical protein